jgi:hypothetical protein
MPFLRGPAVSKHRANCVGESHKSRVAETRAAMASGARIHTESATMASAATDAGPPSARPWRGISECRAYDRDDGTGSVVCVSTERRRDFVTDARPDPRIDALPARILPLLYVGTAHVSLALAFACVALWPYAVTGFFYHSWMVALVHLVTLGWITLSIVGSLYIVAPVALELPLPARRGDYIAFALLVIGLIGMVAHFWIEEFGGMAWSAGTAACGVFYVMSRVIVALRRAKAPRAVTLHIRLAFINLMAAATAGVLLATDKVYHFLPGYVMSNVFAHAHLAAIGWATMMVVGVGYRLLPMVLPSAPPRGSAVAASAVLLETGVIGLFVGLILRASWTPLAGALIVSGLLTFVLHVIQMIRRPRRRPPRMASNVAAWHVVAAGTWLAAAMVIGVVLLLSPLSGWTLRAAVAYGVFGLVGFLGEMIVGLETRLLPLHAWYCVFGARGFQSPPATPPYAMGDARVRTAVLFLWLFGIPVLAWGFFVESAVAVAAAGWWLLAAVALSAFDSFNVAREVFSVTV